MTSITRSDGTYSGAAMWQDAAANSEKIESAAHDTHDEALATAIRASLPKDGSEAMTGDLDMGGNDITNVGIVGGSSYRKLSTNTTLSERGDSVVCDVSGGAVTLTIPSDLTVGDTFIIHCYGHASNEVTIDRNGHTIYSGGAAGYTFSADPTLGNTETATLVAITTSALEVI